MRGVPFFFPEGGTLLSFLTPTSPPLAPLSLFHFFFPRFGEAPRHKKRGRKQQRGGRKIDCPSRWLQIARQIPCFAADSVPHLFFCFVKWGYCCTFLGFNFFLSVFPCFVPPFFSRPASCSFRFLDGKGNCLCRFSSAAAADFRCILGGHCGFACPCLPWSPLILSVPAPVILSELPRLRF